MKRPAFELGKGGCSCPSCASTAQFWDKGFAAWPRGNPAGRGSVADYAAHVTHSRSGGGKGFHFDISPEAVYPRMPGLVYPVAPNAQAVRWNTGRGQTYVPQKSKGRIAPADARPQQGSSPAAHFPEQDRPLQTARIYAMPKPEPKRPVGRPQIGKRYLIVLDDAAAKNARALGAGNLSEGVRQALQAARAPRRARS